MIVVDASVLANVLLRTPESEALEARLAAEPAGNLHAPHLIDLEVAQVLRRYIIMGEIDSARGRAALIILGDLAVVRHPHNLFLRRVWTLRDNFTAYDAIYVVLAEVLDAPLLTRDRRLAAAAKSHVRVEIV